MKTTHRISHPDDPDSLPISALNALVYCPRLFHYQFVQGESMTNEFVLEGTLLHERMEQESQHTVHDHSELTNLFLSSDSLRLSGFADVVEEEDGILLPVEYKHGRAGPWLNDSIQLCAQALCLEEQQPDQPLIPHGYISYAGSHERERIQIPFTPELRAETQTTIARAFEEARRTTPPPPLEVPLAARCLHCSLAPVCLPDEVRLLRSSQGDADANTLPD